MTGREIQPSVRGGSRPTGHLRPGDRQVALVDLLDRLLAGGVVVAGEVTLSVADVDMVTISLRALVTSASTLARASGLEPRGAND